MSFAPRNVLITGGAGFIGANFVRHWMTKGGTGKLVVLDALTYAGNERSLSGLETDPRYEFVRGDICDESLVRDLLDRHRVDTLVHFAAESHVDRSILGPDDFVRTNVVGTHTLLKCAKAAWAGLDPAGTRFHHISTDEVYGSLRPDEAPFHEGTPYAPNSPYSATKAASDHLVRAYHETYGLNTTLTNCSNNYGPYHFPEKLIPLTLINILLGRPLPVYGDGRQIRDWLHVSDHCHAITLALLRGEAGGVYNIGGKSEVANIEVVRVLCRLVDERLSSSPESRARFPDSPVCRGGAAADLITFVSDRPGHDRRYAIDFSKAAGQLGYAPARTLADGLRATLDWYLDNTAWWQPLLGRDYAVWLEKNYRR